MHFSFESAELCGKRVGASVYNEFAKKTDIVHSFMGDGSLLDMPQFSRKEVDGLTKTFNMYVNFPDDRWDEIRIAEENTKKGNAKFIV